MSWWMIVLLVLVAIGCIPVGIDAGYRPDGYFVRIKIAAFRITLLPAREKKKPRKQKKKKKQEKSAPAEEKSKQETKEKSAPMSADDIFALVRFGCDVLGDLRRKLRAELVYLHIAFGGEGEKAAKSYARAWALIGALNPMLDRILVIRERDIQPEFRPGEKKLAVDARLILTITIGRALGLGLRAGVGFLKIMNERNKGGATNEPSSV